MISELSNFPIRGLRYCKNTSSPSSSHEPRWTPPTLLPEACATSFGGENVLGYYQGRETRNFDFNNDYDFFFCKQENILIQEIKGFFVKE